VSWHGALSAIGASVGAGAGAEYDAISAQAPVAYWDAAWDLVVQAITRPTLDAYLLSHLQTETDHDYSTEQDEPSSAAGVVAYSNEFTGTLANRFRDGREAARRVAIADLDEAWATLVTKERVHVVVAGDVPFSDVASKVSEAFSEVPGRHTSKFSAPPSPSAPPAASRAVVLPYPDAPNWQIYAYFRGPRVTDPDYPALAVAMLVLDQRLFAEVRQARALAYSVGAALLSSRDSYGRITLATASPSSALPVVAELTQALAMTPPSDDEMSAARALMRSGLFENLRTPPAIVSMLAASTILRGDPLAIGNLASSTDSVTAEDATRAFAKYMRNVSIAAAGAGDSLDEASLLAVVPGGASDAGP
jgi:zinc protease